MNCPSSPYNLDNMESIILTLLSLQKKLPLSSLTMGKLVTNSS